jgi:hypothetical protein
MTLRHCPLYRTPDPYLSVTRPKVPIFPNVIYPTRDAVVAAPQARFELGTCRRCGFSYNAALDGSRIYYSIGYDNHVASAAFTQYYREVARMLIARLAIREGTVYDIGCGKEEFLRIFCELAPGVRGIGIDSSCTPCHNRKVDRGIARRSGSDRCCGRLRGARGRRDRTNDHTRRPREASSSGGW